MLKNVTVNENIITINNMNHPSCVTSFVRCLKKALTRHKDIIVICNCKKGSIFPDACLPISAIINNYKNRYDINFDIQIPENSYLENCNFSTPLNLDVEELKKIKYPLNKVFVYSSDPGYEGQIAQIVQLFIDYMSKETLCEEGVLNSLIWCINEVMDNVLVHSGETTGYVMGQYHPKKKKLAFCVCDCGIGIYETLANSPHNPLTEIDALTIAVNEGVGDGKGQGNGLYGLYQIVMENGGKLTISSGKSSIMLNNRNLKKYEGGSELPNGCAGTIVDFQLDLSKKIDIQSALKTIKGFDGFDIRIDNMWDDTNSEWLRYNVFENCTGTGTRIAGKELRNDVINTLKRTSAPMILDFKDVKTCSSSFIDEFLCKLLLEIGIVDFNRLIKIDNMNDFVSNLFERSTYMRFHNEWENSRKKSDESTK